MSRYKAYTEYKDSGIEWLDEAPSHWTSVPIKYMALENESFFLDGDWIESKDISGDEIRYITTGNVGEGIYKEQGTGFISNEKFSQLDCTEVFAGDILISRLNAPIGRSCVVPELQSRIVTSVDNVIFRPDSKYIREFLVYLFSSGDYFAHTANLARGATMQRISRGLLGNIRTVMPPLKEQKNIADFLDHETVKIDTLIEKQQQLIKLLKEKRQAVISHAVIKGLNPYAPLRDSGVEWLGEVPEHWRVLSLKYLANLVGTGGTPKEESSFSESRDVHWFTPGDLNGSGILSTSSKYITSLSCEKGDTKLYSGGSVLIIGIGATLGKVGYCLENFSCNQQINIVTPNKNISAEFMMHALTVQAEQMRQLSNFSTIGIMNQEKTKLIKIVVPPLSEQKEINEHLNKQFEKFEIVLGRAAVQIDLLQERRTALISAAVTGKIDVRNWQAPSQTTNQKITA